MNRRDFSRGTELVPGAATAVLQKAIAAGLPSAPTADSWGALRDLFPLTRDYIQLATFLLAVAQMA